MATEQGDLSEAEEPEECSETEERGVHQSLHVSSNHQTLDQMPSGTTLSKTVALK